MGSVVKSIGKVFKKIGKGLKKIAPILLVAAAAYVGYGYATGWQGAGWPRITEWGKSLMSGIRGGANLSESAVQASQTFANPTYQNQMGLPEVPTSAVTTPANFPPDVVGQTIAQDPFAFEDVRAAASQAGEGVLRQRLLGDQPGILGRIGTEMGSQYSDLIDNSTLKKAGGAVMDAIVPPAGADTVALVPEGIDNELFMPQGVATGPSGGGGYGDQVLSPDAESFADQSVLADATEAGIPASESTADAASNIDKSLRTYYKDPFAFEDAKASASVKSYKDAKTTWDWIADKIPTEKIGQAWEFYKNLWKKDPLVALYGTQKVLEMILAYLDESDELASNQKRHVAGMPPRSMADVMKTHKKATAAGLRHDKTGIWAQRPSSGMQGPVNPVRASAINRQPPGLLGRNPQRALV